MDFWGDLIPNAKFLLVYRAPWEAVDSLYRRGDITFHRNPEFALKIWMNYNQLILDFYSRFPEKCLLSHLSQIVSSPAAFVELLSQRLSIPLSAPEADLYDASLLKQEQSSSQREILIQRYFPEAYALYQQLNLATGVSQALTPPSQDVSSPTTWILQDWLDLRCLQKKFKDEVTELRTQIFSVQQAVADARQANELLQAEKQILQDEHCLLKEQFHHELEYKQAEIAAMKTSKFWRLRSQWFKLKSLLHLKE